MDLYDSNSIFDHEWFQKLTMAIVYTCPTEKCCTENSLKLHVLSDIRFRSQVR